MSQLLILQDFDQVLHEVLIAISPVLVMFFIFLLAFKLPREMLGNLLKGVIFAFIGLALFLQGVKVGFMPVGMEMGAILGSLPNRWILIPLGFLLGFLATLAEPAVRILSSQIEKSSSGYIRNHIILLTLCTAVGIFVALGMTRVVYGIHLYYIIIPGYLLAIILMFFSKPSFTAIAFDSGGVATGPMTVTFIMALAVGAADVIEGRDSVIDGFGLVALVALAPIIMVMLLGFLYSHEDDANLESENKDDYIEKEIDVNGNVNQNTPLENKEEAHGMVETEELTLDENDQKSSVVKDDSDHILNKHKSDGYNEEDNFDED